MDMVHLILVMWRVLHGPKALQWSISYIGGSLLTDIGCTCPSSDLYCFADKSMPAVLEGRVSPEVSIGCWTI